MCIASFNENLPINHLLEGSYTQFIQIWLLNSRQIAVIEIFELGNFLFWDFASSSTSTGDPGGLPCPPKCECLCS